MTANRLRILRRKRGMTLEELARAVGTTRATIHRYESGVITNIPHERVVDLARALDTTPSEILGWSSIEPSAPKRLPLLGSISCGEPIFADEERGEYLLASGIDADFCLTAHGDSMIGARIFDGDTVFIRAQDTVENGEIAAVIIGNEATLKRVYYYPEKEKLVLSPENPHYEPMVFIGIELSEIKILGKAVAFQSVI